MTVAPIASGCVSFISSSTIATMILRSSTRLTKPYRRIVFGMCMYDILQSLGVMASSFLSPEDSSRLWAFGNDTTCSAQGFLAQLGSTGSPLYSLSLTIFYLCVIKYNMRVDRFREEIESYLHFVPNVWAWSSSILLVWMGYFNHAGNGCWIAAYPQECAHNPDIDCERGRHAFIFRWIFVGIPIIICFIVCTVIMVIITAVASDQANRNRGYRPEILHNNSGAEQPQESSMRRLVSSIFPSYISIHEHEPQTNTFASVSRIRNSQTSVSYAPTRRQPISSITGTETSTRVNLVLRRQKEVKEQAIFFIVAFLCTYTLSYINRIVEQIVGTSPFWLRLMARIFNSFQGFFNLLVYTRPHVTSLRRKNKELTWFQAFWAVLKKGGDNERPNARRNSSVSIPAQPQTSRRRQQQDPLHNAPVEERNESVQAPVPRSANNSFLNMNRKSRSTKSNGEVREEDIQQIMNTVAVMNNKEQQCKDALLVRNGSLSSEVNEDNAEKGLVISESSTPDTKDEGSD